MSVFTVSTSRNAVHTSTPALFGRTIQPAKTVFSTDFIQLLKTLWKSKNTCGKLDFYPKNYPMISFFSSLMSTAKTESNCAFW